MSAGATASMYARTSCLVIFDTGKRIFSGWVIGISAGGGSAAVSEGAGVAAGRGSSSPRFECQVPNPSDAALPKNPVAPAGSPSLGSSDVRD